MVMVGVEGGELIGQLGLLGSGSRVMPLKSGCGCENGRGGVTTSGMGATSIRSGCGSEEGRDGVATNGLEGV